MAAVNEHLDDFLIYIGSEKGLSPNTIEAYQRDCLAFVNFLDYASGSYIPGLGGDMASIKIASSLVVGLNVIMLPGNAVKTIVTTADNKQLSQDTPVAPSFFSGRRVSWRELIVDQ